MLTVVHGKEILPIIMKKSITLNQEQITFNNEELHINHLCNIVFLSVHKEKSIKATK